MLFHYTKNAAFPLFHNASIAVDLFFMLSGFVIAHSYGNQLKAGLTYSKYVLKRAIRLYPMFILGISIGVPVLCVLASMGQSTIPMPSVFTSTICNFFFIPYINSYTTYNIGATEGTMGEVFPSDPSSWSLFFEMVVSLAFPFLLRLTPKKLFAVAVLSYAILLGQALFSASYGPTYRINMSVGW